LRAGAQLPSATLSSVNGQVDVIDSNMFHKSAVREMPE
jgi:hypothetical protein